MVTREKFQEKLESILKQMKSLGAECEELIFEKPSDFRSALLTISSHCVLDWAYR